MQVDRGSEQDVGTLSASFDSEEVADLGEQVWIPTGAERDAGGHGDAGCPGAAVALAADSRRTVGHLELGDSRVGKGFGSPVGLAGDQPALVVEAQ